MKINFLETPANNEYIAIGIRLMSTEQMNFVFVHPSELAEIKFLDLIREVIQHFSPELGGVYIYFAHSVTLFTLRGIEEPWSNGYEPGVIYTGDDLLSYLLYEINNEGPQFLVNYKSLDNIAIQADKESVDVCVNKWDNFNFHLFFHAAIQIEYDANEQYEWILDRSKYKRHL